MYTLQQGGVGLGAHILAGEKGVRISFPQRSYVSNSSIQVCAVCAALPLAILMPSIPFLYELEGETKSVREQIRDIWEMVQLKAVWKPMTFIYCYNVLQTPNVAWNSYLQLTLKFPAWFIGFVALVGRWEIRCEAATNEGVSLTGAKRRAHNVSRNGNFATKE